MLSRQVAQLRDMIDEKNAKIEEHEASIVAHKTETEQEAMRFEDTLVELWGSRETADTWRSKYEAEEARACELEMDIRNLQNELTDLRD